MAKDNRNLYGGQYRLSKRLADEINNSSKFKKLYAHDMSAWIDMNHFDVQNLLIKNRIYANKLKKINDDANRGDVKQWNTQRMTLLKKGIKLLGKKYGVALVDAKEIGGDLRIEVKQSK